MKQTVKTMSALLLTICLVASGFILAGELTPSNAASRVKLSAKKISLQTGKGAKHKTAVIRVRNAGKKVKWSSTNKKIVTVSKTSGKHRQKAVLKAGKKAGKCYIKAKIGKKTLKCRVIVKAYGKSGDGEGDRDIEIRPISDGARDLSAGMAYSPAEAEIPETFGTSVSDFSVRLLQNTMAGDNTGKNVLISPDSVLTALMMTENGAAGTTQEQMAAVMHSGLTVDQFNNYLSALHNRLGKPSRPIYSSANSIWVDKVNLKLSNNFIGLNKAFHNAVVYEAPFADPRTISDMNNWVYNNTRNMIDKIIDDLSPQDRIVLINAVAFEGNWEEPFTEGQVNSTSYKFRPETGSPQNCNMLVSKDHMPYVKIGGADGFVKPYEGGKIAFVGILPPEGKTVDQYVAGLSGSDFITGWKNRKQALVDMRLPEFKYDYGLSLKNVLTGMGMTEAFDVTSADFSGMTASGLNENLYIDDVIHKTHIDLDRNGTKAAAATAVVMKAGSAPPHEEQVVRIYLDRPFVYALIDTETGSPLFIGAVRTIN